MKFEEFKVGQKLMRRTNGGMKCVLQFGIVKQVERRLIFIDLYTTRKYINPFKYNICFEKQDKLRLNEWFLYPCKENQKL